MAERAYRPSRSLMHGRIASDFDVLRIGSSKSLTLFGAERKAIWHFIAHSVDDTFVQYHIPHYVIARALSEAASRRDEILQFALDDGLAMLTQNGRLTGLVVGHEVAFLDSEDGASACKAMLSTKVILASAAKRVTESGGVYAVSRAKTHSGNCVKSESRLLVEGIAFERCLLGRLDGCKNFGLYSAYCTHRDAVPSPLDQRKTIESMLNIHFDWYREHPPSEDLLDLFMEVQDRVLHCRIWDPKRDVPRADAIEFISQAFSTLHPIAKTQLVLLNGMHGGSLLLHLGLLNAVIPFSYYKWFQTQNDQPDSPREQWIRSTTSYIELFGRLGMATSDRE